MLRSRPPVPCVAVAIAPAIDWTSMSPTFSSASPSSASRRLSAWIVIPACTRTRPEARSASSTAAIRRSDIRWPLVGTRSPKECPAPATRTRRRSAAACPIAATISAVVAGATKAAGVQCWSPAQLRHMPQL